MMMMIMIAYDDTGRGWADVRDCSTGFVIFKTVRSDSYEVFSDRMLSKTSIFNRQLGMSYWVQVEVENGETLWSNYSAGVREVECLQYCDTSPVPPTKPSPLPNPGHVIHIHTASEEPKHLTRETRNDSNQCVVWFLIIAFVSFVVIVIERVIDS